MSVLSAVANVGTEIIKTRAETPAMVTPKMELIENQTANGVAVMSRWR